MECICKRAEMCNVKRAHMSDDDSVQTVHNNGMNTNVDFCLIKPKAHVWQGELTFAEWETSYCSVTTEHFSKWVYSLG